MSVAQKDILNGWKEIAGYVARDIRTVERWEKQRGLPVRRVPGAGRATVYARISELEEWLASKPLENELPSLADETPVELTPQEFFTTPVPVVVAAAQPEPAQRPKLWFYSSIAAVVLLILGGAVFVHHGHAANPSVQPITTAEPPSRLPSAPHSSVPGVEDSYLRGSYLYEQRTPETLSKAVDSFNFAIKQDPQYAPAYAGLANTYNLLREYSMMPDKVAYPKAREAAERAIALDPSQAQAHVSLGFVTYYWDMNPAKAEREFETAIKLDPTLAQAHHWYGSVLTHEGRFTEALHELDIAQHLQPSSSAILTSKALALGMTGHPQEARAMIRDLLSHDNFAQDPNSSTAHIVLAIVSGLQPRDYETQFAQWREVAAFSEKNGDFLKYANAVEPAYKRGGESAMWEATLAYEQAAHPGEATERMADAAANLKRFDEAFRYLNQMADHHDPRLDGLSLDPALIPLHADPRFTALRTRLGLTQPIA